MGKSESFWRGRVYRILVRLFGDWVRGESGRDEA